MTTPFQPAPTATVVYGADGTPYYAAPAPLTHPPALYQPAPVPVPGQQAAPTVVYLPAPLPQQQAAGQAPVRDPWPARLLAGGIGVGGAGLGLGFLLQTLAAATTALGFLAAALGVLYLLKNSGGTGGRGGHGAVNVSVSVSNRNR